METSWAFRASPRESASPHSLGKLIEWKRVDDGLVQVVKQVSPLAGETN